PRIAFHRGFYTTRRAPSPHASPRLHILRHPIPCPARVPRPPSTSGTRTPSPPPYCSHPRCSPSPSRNPSRSSPPGIRRTGGTRSSWWAPVGCRPRTQPPSQRSLSPSACKRGSPARCSPPPSSLSSWLVPLPTPPLPFDTKKNALTIFGKLSPTPPQNPSSIPSLPYSLLRRLRTVATRSHGEKLCGPQER
ncbi:2-methoxy-6-polyprenyl-14-benzoquinol methylase mitochondrial, partial [Zea mays]